MLEEGVTKSVIHSLIGNSEKEKEYAVKLLLEFCNDEAYCKSVASEKGALVLLSSMTGNLELPALSNLVDEVFKKMERIEEIVQPLAAAGRFEPLINRLCQGMLCTCFCFNIRNYLCQSCTKVEEINFQVLRLLCTKA